MDSYSSAVFYRPVRQFFGKFDITYCLNEIKIGDIAEPFRFASAKNQNISFGEKFTQFSCFAYIGNAEAVDTKTEQLGSYKGNAVSVGVRLYHGHDFPVACICFYIVYVMFQSVKVYFCPDTVKKLFHKLRTPRLCKIFFRKLREFQNPCCFFRKSVLLCYSDI